MAKDRGNNGQEQLDRMTQAAGFASTWLAEIAEQNLKQGIGALDGMLTTTRKAADAFGHQASSISEYSAALFEQSMRNAAELGNRLARSKDPLQWAEAHSEFLSKQAEAVASRTHSLGDALIKNSNEVAHAGLRQASHRAEEAA